jgi:hypothetical protein
MFDSGFSMEGFRTELPAFAEFGYLQGNAAIKRARTPKSTSTLPDQATHATARGGQELAYSIVSHRERHGLFTHCEELAEVKGFPADAIDAIKARVTLVAPGEVEEGTSAKRLKARPAAKDAKKPTCYTRKIRMTRRSSRMKHSA